MDKIIEINDLTYFYKTYDEQGKIVHVTGVEKMNLDIFAGEFIALVGHNGSGKSTLAKLLNGLLLPRSGKVFSCGLDTSDNNNLFEIRKNVGMVFQNPDNQMVASIIEEDVAFGPENLAIPQKEIVERVNWALDCVGMSEYAKRSPSKLSGGQKQRIAIAGALAIKPKVLVLDEATAMLDPQGRAEVLSVAHKLNKEQGMTIILITHFMEEALSADRVVVINKGKIHRAGAPMEIFDNAQDLKEIGLLLPRAIELNKLLISHGISLDEDNDTAQKVGENLCRLL